MPTPEIRAARIAAATIVALQQLDGISELDAMGILLEHTNQRLAEIRQQLLAIQSTMGPTQ